MKCKKCRKEVPDGSKFCNHCGSPIEKTEFYRRPDGLYEKSITYKGKRHVFRGKTQKIVFQKIREFQDAAEKGPLFQDIAEKWYDEHFPTLAYTTQRGYEFAYREVVEYFSDNYINQITPSMINKYIKSLPSTYARKTCSTRLLVLNLIFKYTITEDIINDNPCACISIPKGHSAKKRRGPTESEINAIKTTVDFTYRNANMGLLAVFLLYTGCRKGEALALQYRDIDYDNARVTINKSIYYAGTTPNIKTPKTEAGIRTVIIPQYLLRLLPKGKSNHYLFSDTPDNPMRGAFYESAWKAWQKESGLTLTAHQLRHGYATLLLEADISTKDAQDLLGHADASTTQNIYQDISQTRKKETEIKLNNFLQ